MLDPEYLLRISEGAEDIAEMLHNKVIKRVVSRVMTRVAKGKDYLLTARDKWELESLQEAGLLAEDLIKEIAAATKKQQQEIREAFEDAGVRTIRYDNAIYQAAGISTQPLEQSPQLVRVLERGYKATMGEWENFTRTYANAGQRAYLKAVDKAYVLTQSGTVSYSEAVKEAIEEIAAAGGVKVDYPSGRSDTIETATLRAVRTGIAQTCAEVTERRMDEVGWDIVLTSAHLGARTGDGMDNHTNHFWWQGRFFSRSGNDPRFPPFRVCGLGDVQGISGANCRHSFGPGDGEHNPYQDFDSDENQKAYEMTQRARELERRIRNTKREVMGLRAALDAPSADPKALTDVQKAYDRKAAVLQRQNKEYNEFCDTNNFKKRDDRITVAQWDRHQASMARVAAKRYNTPNQNYKPVVAKGDPVGFTMLSGQKITTNPIAGYSNVYVTAGTKIKPRALHNINKNTVDAVKALGIPKDKTPKVVIVGDDIMITALGKYDATTNTVYYSPEITNSETMAANGGLGSVEYHEMCHAKQAYDYVKNGNIITKENYGEYIRVLNQKCKQNVDNLGVNEYNVGEISEYAKSQYYLGRFDEVEAEIMTKRR